VAGEAERLFSLAGLVFLLQAHLRHAQKANDLHYLYLIKQQPGEAPFNVNLQPDYSDVHYTDHHHRH